MGTACSSAELQGGPWENGQEEGPRGGLTPQAHGARGGRLGGPCGKVAPRLTGSAILGQALLPVSLRLLV